MVNMDANQKAKAVVDQATGKKPTLKDVAALVGVHSTTVGRILRGDTRYFNKKLIERVRQEAQRLGYVCKRRTRRKMQPATLWQVAEKAAVAYDTARQVLKGEGLYTQWTKTRVHRAADALGYVYKARKKKEK
jgi:DNA-binding LacI/PurR family transcriptional regulator